MGRLKSVLRGKPRCKSGNLNSTSGTDALLGKGIHWRITMGSINMNDLASEITRREKGKKRIGIGQVKEVLRITFELLNDYEPKEVMKAIKRYDKKR